MRHGERGTSKLKETSDQKSNVLDEIYEMLPKSGKTHWHEGPLASEGGVSESIKTAPIYVTASLRRLWCDLMVTLLYTS